MDRTVKIESKDGAVVSAAVLRPTVMNKQTQNNGQKSFLNKVYSKTRKFILKCHSRYTSKIVGRSTRVKSAEHGKIFKNLSQI